MKPTLYQEPVNAITSMSLMILAICSVIQTAIMARNKDRGGR